jgi:hypothetical protein
VSDKTIGQIAYEGYYESCGGKSLISGAQLPQFHEQREDIRNAWEAAANAVSAECIRTFQR